MDRRIQRTRALLQDALLSLILEQGYESLTVQEIVDRANLGRSTFYVHYRDKLDLLLSTMEEGFRELERKVMAENAVPGTFAPLEIIFKHAAEKRDLYLVILHGAGKMDVYKQARDFLADRSLQIMRKYYTEPAMPLPFVSTYFAGSFLSMLIWWLENDMPYSSSEMVSMIRVLFQDGMLSALGGKPAGLV